MRVVTQARLEHSGGYTPDQLRPPPHTGRQAARMGWRRGLREHPGERVGARGRGRGRAHEWHTRVTAMHGQGG